MKRCLGLDLGTKTLGVATSDRLGIIASPYKTIKFSNIEDAIKEVLHIIKEKDIGEIALGLPLNMDNSKGFASNRSLDFKERLEKVCDLPITLIDERLSTVEAENYLLKEDMSRKKRKEVIDAVAASVILNTYIRMKGNKR